MDYRQLQSPPLLPRIPSIQQQKDYMALLEALPITNERKTELKEFIPTLLEDPLAIITLHPTKLHFLDKMLAHHTFRDEQKATTYNDIKQYLENLKKYYDWCQKKTEALTLKRRIRCSESETETANNIFNSFIIISDNPFQRHMAAIPIPPEKPLDIIIGDKTYKVSKETVDGSSSILINTGPNSPGIVIKQNEEAKWIICTTFKDPILLDQSGRFLISMVFDVLPKTEARFKAQEKVLQRLQTRIAEVKKLEEQTPSSTPTRPRSASITPRSSSLTPRSSIQKLPPIKQPPNPSDHAPRSSSHRA